MAATQPQLVAGVTASTAIADEAELEAAVPLYSSR